MVCGLAAEQKGVAAGQRNTVGIALAELQSLSAVVHGQMRLAAAVHGRICLACAAGKPHYTTWLAVRVG